MAGVLEQLQHISANLRTTSSEIRNSIKEFPHSIANATESFRAMLQGGLNQIDTQAAAFIASTTVSQLREQIRNDADTIVQNALYTFKVIAYFLSAILFVILVLVAVILVLMIRNNVFVQLINILSNSTTILGKIESILDKTEKLSKEKEFSEPERKVIESSEVKQENTKEDDSNVSKGK